MKTQRSVDEPLAFCTIVSRNYLAQASLLAETIRSTNPGCPIYILLVDPMDESLRPADNVYTLIALDDLPIPDLPRFCFQYTVLELNTATKPYFLEHLFERFGHHKLVYLDPDIMLFDSFEPLARLLDQSDVVLTPHLTEACPLDNKMPSEPSLLQSGTYNLGFLALRWSPQTRLLLRWWQERLYVDCRIDHVRGLFVDQKWIDLVPGLFESVHVLRDPGYNVAYWNLHGRRVEKAGSRFTVNGEPLYFFHFSGYDPRRPGVISKHQNRLTMDSIGSATHLFESYAAGLRAHRFEECQGSPYGFGRFDNGEPIVNLIRSAYAQLGDDVARFGNPFQTAHEGSFYRYLTEYPPEDLSPLALMVHSHRVDLQCYFPDLHGRDKEPYRSWLAANARLAFQLDKRFFVSQAVPSVPKHLRPALPRPRGHKALQRPFGVNLAGHFSAEYGTSEATRAVVRCLEAAGIPHCLNNLVDPYAEMVDRRYERFSNDNPYAINILQLNADQALPFAEAWPGYLQDHLNVGYWNWELANFPEVWSDRALIFDEIWTPSTFTREAVAQSVTVPVQLVPFSISVPETPAPGIDRARFGIPEQTFLFLFAFDYRSIFARKNPLATVEAFRRAFGDDPQVRLVLKTVHASSEPFHHTRLLEAVRGCDNIQIITDLLNRDEMHTLMRLCDCYVSLHRCEGYGLTLAEAMAYGKPVIGTSYSAVTDYMNSENSRPVRYRLTPIDRDYGPYRKGWHWADADIEHAAEQMRRVYEDVALAQRLGKNARLTIERDLSPERVGQLIYSRLMALLARVTAKSQGSMTGTGLLDVVDSSHLPLRVSRPAC